MGCDIHAYVERKHNDKWVFEFELDNETTNRNYSWFGRIAGVRSYEQEGGRTPIGLPRDLSESVRMFNEDWGADGHSHSWMPAKDWVLLAVQEFGPQIHTYQIDGEFRTYDGARTKYLGNAFGEDAPDRRVVFWFDN